MGTIRAARKTRPKDSRPFSLGQLLYYQRHFHGLFSRVARQLQVTPQHVSRVACGERYSRRVERALIEELKRMRAA